MVTVRQFTRGIGRVARAIERDAQRAQRQQLAHEKAVNKLAMLNSAADAAEAYDWLVSRLVNAHRISFERRDWHDVAAREMPPEPTRSDAGERAAAAALEGYSPNWFARTFGLAGSARNKLAQAVSDSRDADEAAHRQKVELVRNEQAEITHAKCVLSLESEAVAKAVSEHAVIDGGAIEGATLIVSNGRVIVVVDAADIDDMPTESVALLASGKASVKPLPRAKVLELHRDSVCSGGIRAAAEVLKALPIEHVEVVVHADLLDPATGHIEPKPVLYLKVTAQALALVNLLGAEPAPLVERLGGDLDWSRKFGLRPIHVQVHRLPQAIHDEYGW